MKPIILLTLVAVLFAACRPKQESAKIFTVSSISASPEIATSNPELEQGFNWAREKALTFVQTGKTGPINVSERDSTSDLAQYIPSYWAGYPLRTAFYSRDFCHQVVGAHLLGLEKENFTMLKAFAASATENKKWFPLWAINFDGSPYALDYRGDDFFVREVPAAFELVEKAYTLYRWTGDENYLQDDTLWNFYTKIITDFISLHDEKMPNGVAEGTGTGNIFLGTPTFNEQPDFSFIEAGDGIACQYRALWAYSKMAAVRGRNGLAEEYADKARRLKEYFNTDWGVKNTDTYNRGYTAEQEPVSGWGKENSWFMLMKGITDPASLRTAAYLKFVDERLTSGDGIPENIEAISYVPEVFFLYHENETGWKWMKHILAATDQEHVQSKLTGNNGNYPEVSFVLIANVIEQLLGVEPDAAENRLKTLSHLPTEIQQLAVRSIKIGDAIFSLQHEQQHTTVLKYEEGNQPFQWAAAFPGRHDRIYVNGEEEDSLQGSEFGQDYSYLMIDMNPGDEVLVSLNKQ